MQKMPKTKLFEFGKRTRSILFFIILSLSFILIANMLNAQGAASPAIQNPLCQHVNFHQIESRDRPTLDSLITETKTPIIPDGETLEFTILQPSRKGTVFCATIQDKEIEILTAKNLSGATILTIRTPNIGWKIPFERTQLELVSIPFDDATGKYQLDSPSYFIHQDVRISSWSFSFVASIVLLLMIYLAAAIPVRRLKVARKQSIYGLQSTEPIYPVKAKLPHKASAFILKVLKYLDPVAFTADKSGKANISNLQITWFTLIIFGLLIHVLLRTGQLSDVSNDILLLLGISGASKILSMGIDVTSNRLSLENIAWLRAQGWLKDSNHQTKINWEDLINTNGNFDIYKYQLLLFSLIVGITLTISGLGVLTEFKLPQGFIQLLGLSNVVYILGNTVSPNSIAELNMHTNELRGLERSYPENPSEYIMKARDVASMLTLIYGKDSTYFDPEITASLLEPRSLK